jgi:hypothetical protein
MLELVHKPLAVVCHDAGAANIIYSWIESCVQVSPGLASSIRIYCCGPAKYLIDNFVINQVERCSSLEVAMENAQTLLAGTGWATSLELQALDHAKKLGIRAISVIDHWINYSDRFHIDEWQIDPVEIWVTDKYAKNIAEKTFPEAKIEQMPNLYFSRTIARINALSHSNSSTLKVLYVLEPIRKSWAKGREDGEFDALEYFFSHMDELFHRPVEEVRLRPHPSDPPGKYDRWLVRHGAFRITLDVRSELENSIAWADVVVGCQTMAMAVALESGKRVICSMPPWAPSCALPHDGIEKMALKFLDKESSVKLNTSN